MSRRARGEGTIRQRRAGLWEVRVRLPSGRRKSFYAKSEPEALARLTDARRSMQEGLPLDGPERLTLGQFLADWLEHQARPRLRPSTYESYATIVRLHLVPTLGRIRLRALTPLHVKRALGEKLNSGLSPRRVQFIRSVLRAGLADAVRWGLVGRNVAAEVEPPRQSKRRFQPITEEHAKAILEAIRGHRLEGLFYMALATGLRLGELLALKWSDVDSDARTASIHQSLQWVRGEPLLLPPKNERSIRRVPLPDEAVQMLRAHRRRQLEERLVAGRDWHDSGFVFTNPWGRPLKRWNVYDSFRKRLRSRRVPHVRLHDLRHAYATFLLAIGVDLKRISEMLGHAQISTTADVYAHVQPALLREAADAMDAVLRGLASRD